MTTLGFHYFPDETHYRRADLQAWLPELQALGARWLTVVGSLNRAVPEPFINGLIQARIEPIVHIPAPLGRSSPSQDIGLTLAPLFTTYARWGVKYVALFSEPNMRAAWAPGDWGAAGLVERFLDLLVPALQAQADAGLHPTFPALRAGGDYWDTAFLAAALASLARRGLSSLARQLTFAVNLWTFNRPVDWGAGGPRRWPEARPYLTPPGAQDQRGFHLFEWYDEIIRAGVGEARPILCLAGGPRPGDRTDATLPPVDDSRHASCTHEIAQAAAQDALPAPLLNVNFWLIGAAQSSPYAREAWYRSDGSTLEAVRVLKSIDTLGQKPERRTCDESKALFGGDHGMSRQVEAALVEAGYAVGRLS